DETLHCINVARDATDEIAGAFSIVIRKRKLLNVAVENAPQIMHHPLPDAGREIFFEVRTNRAEYGNHDDREDREIENGKLICADYADRARQPIRHALRSKHVIEDNFQRPRIEQIGNALANDSEECERKCRPVRIKNVGDADFLLHTNRVSTASDNERITESAPSTTTSRNHFDQGSHVILSLSLAVLTRSPRQIRQLINPIFNFGNQHLRLFRREISGAKRIFQLLVTQLREQPADPLRVGQRYLIEEIALLSVITELHAPAIFAFDEFGLDVFLGLAAAVRNSTAGLAKRRTEIADYVTRFTCAIRVRRLQHDIVCRFQIPIVEQGHHHQQTI